MRLIPTTLALLAPFAVAAAGMSPDPTGLWWIPAESGWGLGLVQQQDTVVAVLFVYDDAQRPAWYVATARDTGTHLDPTGEEVFGGTLYHTSGPWFGATFDPNAVGVANVGTLSLAYVPATVGKNIALTYSVNGVSVSKTVQPQTWASNVATLRGGYAGGFTFPALPALPGCGVAEDLVSQLPTTFGVVPNRSTPGVLDINWGSGTDRGCAIIGAYVQRGQLGRLDGILGCGPIGFPLPSDTTITLADISANENGFNASVVIRRGSCTYTGKFGGVRQP